MNIRIDQLVRSLLQKDSLEHCSLPELQQFAGRNPYLGAAQLLLAKKMQAERVDGFEDQLQKTMLYFHNPAWVEHILYDTGDAELIKAKKESASIEITEVATSEVVADQGLTDTTLPTEPETISPEETTAVTVDAIETVQTETAPEPVIEEVVAFSEPTPEIIVPENPEPAETQEVVAVTATAIPETAVINPERDPLLENPAFQTIANDQSGSDLLFEPYHTVDYFASQGIKFREDEKPKDKFGQQLKSFTEWLKTLKKGPATDVNRQNEPATEDKVVKLAENSIREEDVYTEAMAEVWEKQGNSAKAIDIYHKLSLLEPAKSTYFAAKIEDLKKLN
jgi:hypothetical protein